MTAHLCCEGLYWFVGHTSSPIKDYSGFCFTSYFSTSEHKLFCYTFHWSWFDQFYAL